MKKSIFIVGLLTICGLMIALRSKDQQIIKQHADDLAEISKVFDKVSAKSYLSNKERQARVTANQAKWGHEWIMLPNAYYGDWESALYKKFQDDHGGISVPMDKKLTIRDSSLSVYGYLK